MKPLLLLSFVLLGQTSFSQSLDYISVRKKNGRVVKNFYAGSDIILQTTDYAYLQGPVKTVCNDSIFIILYDVRLIPTNYGGFIRDTISTTILGLHYQEIKRIYLNKRKSFVQRNGPGLLMLGGGGYFALNALNGVFYNQSVPTGKRIKNLGISAGVFGLGYLLQKFFRADGFTTTKQKIMYVNLSPKKA
ncbi:hypothetical protein [Flavisolibacter ginsenosidimutans]|uniref:Uncharacterized protein n=1 Tax=Flavisolibacter ginsenosidimutans TaxID=661481 RepID=A0A5B8UGE1_9BACT|nr:hypothetical protein [Flavisolibacter ginsenosidimutans]QEC55170.1 hypothetical protein FSB75_04370 [Flavisolibacter ginsenosidimutans]